MIFGADHCGGSANRLAFLERAKNEREAFMQEFRSRALSEVAPADAKRLGQPLRTFCHLPLVQWSQHESWIWERSKCRCSVALVDRPR